MELCEECGAKEELIDAIANGKIKKLCERCTRIENAIIIRKTLPAQLEAKRPSVAEAMFRATGIRPKPLPKSFTASVPTTITIESLRRRYEEIKARKQQEIVRIETSPKESSDTTATKLEPLDFSPEATKRIKIKDLLERMMLFKKSPKEKIAENI